MKRIYSNAFSLTTALSGVRTNILSLRPGAEFTVYNAVQASKRHYIQTVRYLKYSHFILPTQKLLPYSTLSKCYILYVP